MPWALSHIPRCRGHRVGAALLAAVLAACIALVALPAAASVTATAAVERCVGLGVDPLEPLGCSRKLVMKLTVDGRQVSGTEADWRATVSHASDATDLPNASVTFAPLTVSAALSPTQQRYALRYAREFSRTLWAEPVSSGALPGCDVLEDTCGSYTRVDGTFVAESNGLCCECSQCLVNGCDGLQMEDLCMGSSFGTLCLRSSNDTYSGYELGPLSLWYTLGVSVRGAGLQSPSSDGGVAFTVTTSTPLARADVTSSGTGMRGSATLSVTSAAPGAAAGAQTDFSQYVLFVPSAPVNSTLVAAGAAEWMLLAPSLVTLDGSQCGRVGVSQEAWEAVGQAQCMEAKGSCYGRQLGELRAEDEARMERGQNALYLAEWLGRFEREAVEATPGGQPVDSLLAETTAAPTMSLVLVLSADVLDLLPAPADGELTRVTAPDTPHGETATVVTAVVRNTDALAAYFYVSLVNCTPGVSPAGRVTAMPLGAGDAGTVLLPATQPVVDAERTLGCTVVLRDAVNATVATRWVAWSAGGAAGGGGGNGGNSSGSGPGSEDAPVDVGARQRAMCGACSLTDFACIFPNACFWQTFTWLLVVEAGCFVWWCCVHAVELWLVARYEREQLSAAPSPTKKQR